MAVSPNRFPNKEGGFINEKLLSKLFCALLKPCQLPRDSRKLIANVSRCFVLTDSPKTTKQQLHERHRALNCIIALTCSTKMFYVH